MNRRFASIALAPLLIAQGLYIRHVTPRLPEPPGERFGVSGSGPSLNLLILGDSAAAGVGVPTQSQALSGQLVCALASDFRVSWKLIAQRGQKAEDVRSTLQKTSPEKFDVVVTSIGVNDVTHGTSERKWIDRQCQIIGLLESKFHAQDIVLSGIPPMHLFPALPQPLRWYLGMRANRFNHILKNIAQNRKGCEFLQTDFPFEKAYMASDGFHPGAPAYSIWAGHIALVIRRAVGRRFAQEDQR